MFKEMNILKPMLLFLNTVRHALNVQNMKPANCTGFLFCALNHAFYSFHGVLFFLVKHKKEPALATRVKDERWSVYSFKRGMQQLPDRLEEEASQRKEAELLRDTPCSPLQWKDGKFLVSLFVLILYVLDNNFSVMFEGSSWVEPVLIRG